MLNPSVEIIQLLAVFSTAMTAPTFRNALILLYGAILAPGRRTVTTALRMMGLEQEKNFSKYHQVLNRARWLPMLLSWLLLRLLIKLFVPKEEAVVLLADETLERRQGQQVKYKSYFRDAVRSTAKHVVLSLGIRWLCFCLLAKVPWSRRKWALPFLVMPALSEKRAEQLGKQYHSPVDLTIQIIKKIRHWLPNEEIELSADGGFAAVELVRTCQSFDKPVRFVCRGRLDAALYELTSEQPKSKRGPKPKKGKRQPGFQELLDHPQTSVDKPDDPDNPWKKTVVGWYGGGSRELEVITGISFWHSKPPSKNKGKQNKGKQNNGKEGKEKDRTPRKGLDPVLVRWVLVRCPSDPHFQAAVFFCSDVHATPEQILALSVGRWNIEITFEEIRAHMGFETQRHWSTCAIGRVTPCLFGLFSLVVAMAKVLYPHALPVRQSSWYQKQDASFADALAAVRSHLWSRFNYSRSSKTDDLCLIPRTLLLSLQDAVCYVR